MIICEVGHNHLGNEEYGFEYINKLLKFNIDAITFQIRESTYYNETGRSKFKLTDDFYIKASKMIQNNNKKIGIALCDEEYINFFENLNIDFYKIIRNDINNYSLINKLIKTNKIIYVSTGMSNFEEIENFFLNIKNASKNQIILNHTQLSYDLNETNLKAITNMKNKFNVPVSFGSHSTNKNILILSLAFEPSDILFYVKGSKTDNHPDEKHAISLDNLEKLLNDLNELPSTLGTGNKIKMENTIN